MATLTVDRFEFGGDEVWGGAQLTGGPDGAARSTTPTPPKDPSAPGAPSLPAAPTTGLDWTGARAADSKTGGAGADHFWGRDGGDKLLGSMGDDTLEGQAGRDTLVGGQGDDLLIGGGEDDVYKLDPDGGADRIQGFATHAYSGEHDHIDLTALGVTQANFAGKVSITDSADGALITVGDTSVTVLGMHAASFDSSDFLLG